MSEIKFTKLNEFSTNEIMSELLSRFDHAVFSGVRVNVNKHHCYLWDCVGDETEVTRLCVDLIVDTRQYFEEEAEDVED